jgi:DNA-binding transcriptional MerR regulator
MRIGEVARRTGLTVHALRFYERKGLLPRAARGPSNYRQFTARSIERLTFIREAQELGFTLSEVRTFVDLRNTPMGCAELRPPSAQQVLDTALAWAVMNNHFEVADFLLAHGADVNTNWCSHEAASILHELVWYRNYEAMQFLIDRGIDMTIRDYRWGATAEGWAAVAAKDEKMAQFLRDAQQRREQASR